MIKAANGKIEGECGTNASVHKIGIEVEMSSFQFKFDEILIDKTELTKDGKALSQEKIDEKREALNKTVLAECNEKRGAFPFYKFVIEGMLGSSKPYIEIVSAPLHNGKDLQVFFDVVRHFRQVALSRTECKTFGDFLKKFEVEGSKYLKLNPKTVYQEAKAAERESSTSNPGTLTSVHVNVSFPFDKIATLVDKNDYVTDKNMKEAFNVTKDKVGDFSQGMASLKTLVALFYYQRAALNFRLASNVKFAKENCSVLVKASRDDIIKKILSPDEQAALKGSEMCTKIANGMERMIDICCKRSGEITAEQKSIKAILPDETNRDEVRASGNLPVTKDKRSGKWYVVVEFRGKGNNVAEPLKEALKAYCDPENREQDPFRGFFAKINDIYKLV